MTRILIAECKQEVSTFNPVASHFEDFRTSAGGAFLRAHRGVSSEVSGAVDVLSARADVEIVPGYSARSITSGGLLTAAGFERLAAEFLAEVERRSENPLDGVLFCLHGAMAAENEADPEGYLLEETRRLLGEEIPIVVSLDLHGILTDRTLVHADAVVPYHTYPHVDFYETGARAATLLLRIVAGEVNPVTARVAIPALVRGDELITETGLLGRFMQEAKRIEEERGGLSAGVFIGNPFTDVPELGSSSVVTIDGNAQRAAREAERLAHDVWQVRERMQARLVGLGEMVDRTVNATGTVILTDAADATSSGASGDGNEIVNALTEAGYQGSILAPLVDPPAVGAAFEAGVGSVVQVTLGGSQDPGRFTPMPVDATVRMLSDGNVRSESHGDTWRGGRTAVLQSGRITFVVTSRPVSLYDRSLFLSHGQDPRIFDAVVVKSPHCQAHFYADWAGEVLNVDASGSTSANLPTLGHRRCRRPMYPLDPEAVFDPQVEIYTRRGHDVRPRRELP